MKVINLSAKTPTQTVTVELTISVCEYRDSQSAAFNVQIESPELIEVRDDGGHAWCYGFLKEWESKHQYSFRPDFYHEEWNEYSTYTGTYSQSFSTSSEVEEYVKELVREIKSDDKLKREDYKIKQEWLNSWEFVEE